MFAAACDKPAGRIRLRSGFDPSGLDRPGRLPINRDYARRGWAAATETGHPSCCLLLQDLCKSCARGGEEGGRVLWDATTRSRGLCGPPHTNVPVEGPGTWVRTFVTCKTVPRLRTLGVVSVSTPRISIQAAASRVEARKCSCAPHLKY